MPPSSPAEAVEIGPPERLEALAPEWSALWRRCPTATPFEAPEWLLPWARHHAPDRCAAVTLRHRGRLVGLIPVFAWQGALMLAGTGPSDRGDALLEPGHAGGAARLLAALPAVPCGRFERIELRQLPPDSPLLAAPPPPRWSSTEAPGEPCLVAPLEGEDGLAALSQRRRANWSYAVRRLEREGATIRTVPEAGLEAASADLLRLHALRWQAKGEPGVLGEPRTQAFLRESLPALARAGLLRLWELRLAERRFAMILVLAGRRAHYHYIGGFDPALARLSPAAALIGAAMRAAHREGAAAFDFLRGNEPYKRDWGALPAPTVARTLNRIQC